LISDTSRNSGTIALSIIGRIAPVAATSPPAMPSVDDDLRVLFRWNDDEAFLVNIGSHDWIY
jgi:hypothetical protein